MRVRSEGTARERTPVSAIRAKPEESVFLHHSIEESALGNNLGGTMAIDRSHRKQASALVVAARTVGGALKVDERGKPNRILHQDTAIGPERNLLAKGRKETRRGIQLGKRFLRNVVGGELDNRARLDGFPFSSQ